MHFQIGLFLWELQEIRDMFYAKCICWKIFEHIGIGMAFSHVFFNYNAWNRYSYRDVFRTLSNIYVWAFFAKIVKALRKKVPS